jgi:hypothetical protein
VGSGGIWWDLVVESNDSTRSQKLVGSVVESFDSTAFHHIPPVAVYRWKAVESTKIGCRAGLPVSRGLHPRRPRSLKCASPTAPIAGPGGAGSRMSFIFSSSSSSSFSPSPVSGSPNPAPLTWGMLPEGGSFSKARSAARAHSDSHSRLWRARSFAILMCNSCSVASRASIECPGARHLAVSLSTSWLIAFWDAAACEVPLSSPSIAAYAFHLGLSAHKTAKPQFG